MPVLLNPETDEPIAMRCAKHEAFPVLNLNTKLANRKVGMECGGCVADAVADAVMANVNDIIEKAATRLNFFEHGAGDGFRAEARNILDQLETKDSVPATPKGTKQ